LRDHPAFDFSLVLRILSFIHLLPVLHHHLELADLLARLRDVIKPFRMTLILPISRHQFCHFAQLCLNCLQLPLLLFQPRIVLLA
jgi:hypothetical protein